MIQLTPSALSTPSGAKHSIFLLPTLYVWFARDNDKLPKADAEFVEE